jgi:hypothetical protein
VVVPAAPEKNGASRVSQPPAGPADLSKEYVSAGHVADWPGSTLRTLPHPIDQLSRDLGADIYARMMKDPQVDACVTLLKAAILEDGVQFTSPIEDQEEDGYELAQEIRLEAEMMFKDLTTPFPDVMWDLASAIAYGNRVAEQVYELRTAHTKGKKFLQLAALKPKPIRQTAFVVDKFLNVVGLTSAMGPGLTASNLNPNAKEILPRSKFIFWTNHPEDSDPRGTSVLNSAYTAWWRKYQIIPEYMRFLAQFAGPALIGYAPEGAVATPQVDPLGNPLLDEATGLPIPAKTPEEAVLEALLLFRASAALALPFSSKVDLIQSKGNGEAFMAAIMGTNMEITKAILTQELATEQSQNQARAASQVHQDVLGTIIRQGKASVGRMLVQQILKQWISFNWGEDKVKLCPDITLGSVEKQDKPDTIRAIATLFSSGYLHPTQLPATDQMLGLPVRDLTGDPVPMMPGQQRGPLNPLPGTGQDGSPPDQKPADKGNPTPPPTSTKPRQGGKPDAKPTK